MSIPKEKTILLSIKNFLKDKDTLNCTESEARCMLLAINDIVDRYEDPGYIGGPVVGEAETEEK